MKIQFKGTIATISPVRDLPTTPPTPIQTIVVTEPGYHDGFEKKGKDKHFPIDVLGEAVDKFALGGNFKPGDKVIVSVWADSSQSGEKLFISFKLANIEIFE